MLAQISLFCVVLSAAATSAQAPPAAVSGERAESVYSPSHSEAASHSAAEVPVPIAAHASLQTPTLHWYGWEPLLADALGVGLLALGALTHPVLSLLGAGVFVWEEPERIGSLLRGRRHGP